MTIRSWNQATRSLMRLRDHLDIHSAALADWQQTLDQAQYQIGRLSSAQVHLLAFEIDEVRKNRLEYLATKERVEAGWALYRRWSAQLEFKNSLVMPNAQQRSRHALN